jgi:hypothetical protein
MITLILKLLWIILCIGICGAALCIIIICVMIWRFLRAGIHEGIDKPNE